MESIKEAPAFFVLREVEASAERPAALLDAHDTDGRAVLGDDYAPIDTARSGLARRGDMPPVPPVAHGLARKPSSLPGSGHAPTISRRTLADFTRRHMLAAWVTVSAAMVPGGAFVPRDILREAPAETINFAQELADRHNMPERDFRALDHRQGPLTPNVLRLAAWLAVTDARATDYSEIKHTVLHALFSLVTQPHRHARAATVASARRGS